jgi:hypothetical protein
MKLSTRLTVGLVVLCSASVAFAYQLKCSKDGNNCDVFCDNGMKAGTMYWNGSVWTDGVKSDPNKDAEAKKIVAANGTACK